MLYYDETFVWWKPLKKQNNTSCIFIRCVPHDNLAMQFPVQSINLTKKQKHS
jgi:hypothetical protein